MQKDKTLLHISSISYFVKLKLANNRIISYTIIVIYMKKLFTNNIVLFVLAVLVCLSCQDDEIVTEVLPEMSGVDNTVSAINQNIRALQLLIESKTDEAALKSCMQTEPTTYRVELSTGNSFNFTTVIPSIGFSQNVAYVPKLGVKQNGEGYCWTLDNEDFLLEGGPVDCANATVIPVVGIDKDGYWTITCGTFTQTLEHKAEAGMITSIFRQVDLSSPGKVTFNFSDETTSVTLSIEKNNNPDPPVTGNLRRPITPDNPAWLIHIDVWNNADPLQIIKLIPKDILPYVIFNLSLSVSDDSTTGEWNRVEYGYETIKSWIRTCAEYNVWCMIQPASGGLCHFPDYSSYAEIENSLFNEFYHDYPNVCGFNYCEQFWGFGAGEPHPTVSYPERLVHWTNLMKLNHKYGGYLTISFCGAYWGSALTAIAMIKRDPSFAAECKAHPENLIVCEKFTSPTGLLEIESGTLGTWLSGYAGNYGMRYDRCCWDTEEKWNEDKDYPVAVGAIPMIDHTMFTGQTVYDGPELIWKDCFKESSAINVGDGYQRRSWERFSQFDNINIDIYRKIIDGTIRIMSREEVINRSKVVFINDIVPGNSSWDPGYCSPAMFFEGLYRLDEDGNKDQQLRFFKKTGRYPAIPQAVDLADDMAQSFRIKVNLSQFEASYGDISVKQGKFNRLFPEEYTGNIYMSRYENAWVAYNAYKDPRTGVAPFKYNTADKMELTLAKYSVCAIKEYADKVDFYLTNYSEKGTQVTDVIKVHGCKTKPNYKVTPRPLPATPVYDVQESWDNGTYMLTIKHNGAVDFSINCVGNATGRETQYTASSISIPANPQIYNGPRQCEAEYFAYKNINKVYANPVASSVEAPNRLRNYTALGYINFGSDGAAAVRHEVSMSSAGNYSLKIRYRAEAEVNTVDLYVNGKKVVTPIFAQTAIDRTIWQVVSVGVSLNAGINQIELKANGSTAAADLWLDNFIIE